MDPKYQVMLPRTLLFNWYFLVFPIEIFKIQNLPLHFFLITFDHELKKKKKEKRKKKARRMS